jgi:sterol desaturase/sphingolipid hydroxylase (fatty acid hydroxylase superfamily)
MILLPLFLIPNIINNECPFRLDRESMPSYLEIIVQMLFCMFIEDFLFYLSHRLLHTKYFYSKIHKFHHEYVETVAISATYSHFLEYILGNILPSSVAPLILGTKMHFITYLVYITMVLHESHDGHSGYTFPWSPHRVIPFTFDAEFHIFHHWRYTGNYANYLSIWDRVFGTVNKSYVEYFKNKQNFIENYNKDKQKNIHEIDNSKTK